jgi:hypothetical protein
MAGEGQPAIERLRAYLRELQPGARALLISELERTLLGGDNPAGAEMVLAELRRGFRDGNATSFRVGDPARMFFQLLEPFLVDDIPNHKHHGRIARSTLEPMWLWLKNTFMPEEARAYSNQVEQPRRRDADNAEQLARDFQDSNGRIAQLLEVLKRRQERRRLTVPSAARARGCAALRAILGGRESPPCSAVNCRPTSIHPGRCSIRSRRW